MRPMRSLLATSTSLLALASLVLADADSSDVISLTATNFEATVASEPLMLVEFAVPFYCGTLIQTSQLEEATVLKGKNIKLAKVDCDQEAELCQRNDIQHYPTLKIYKSGIPIDTSSHGGIASYLIRQSLPPVSEITHSDHEDFTKVNKIVVIAYLSSSDSEFAHVFGAVAEDYYDCCVFGTSIEPANAEAANVEPPAIVAYRTFDEPRTEYPLSVSGLGIDEIGDWIDELSVPAIDPLDENFVVYLDSGKLLVVLWLDPTSEGHDKLMDALRPIARGIKPVVDFVWVDATRYSQYVSDRAVNPPDVEWPFFLIYDTQQGDYPIYQSKGIIPELVYLRIHEFLEGELESSLSSAPIPEHQDENIHVVGKNFEEVMFDDSKDVFIEFYSTGCDRCKRLEPAWNSLGNKFAPLLDKITIAKIELPPDVGGRLLELPALKFKPAGSDDFIDHEGDQSLESLIAFVEGNAKNSLEIPEKPFENVEETPVDDAEGTIADDGDAAQAPQSASQP